MKRKTTSPRRWLAVPAGLSLTGIALYVLLSGASFSPARGPSAKTLPVSQGPPASEEIDDASRAQLRQILLESDGAEGARP
jgi:hypothetical protein